MTSHHMAVPTSTVLAVHARDRHKVCVIQHQPSKHRGRMTLVGGKIVLGKQTPEQCIVEEWSQEAGGKGAILCGLEFWAAKDDLYTDVREVTLGKATDNNCPEQLRSTLVTAHYGAPDFIFIGRVWGRPMPLDGEALSCRFIDVRQVTYAKTPDESAFGAEHDLILLLYRLSLTGRPVGATDLADLGKLRKVMPRLLEQHGA